MHAADDRRQRTREAIRTQHGVAGIGGQHREPPLEPCSSAGKPVDQYLNLSRRDDLEPIAALSCSHRSVPRTKRVRNDHRVEISPLHRFKARAEQLVELPLIVRVVALQCLNRLREHAFSAP